MASMISVMVLRDPDYPEAGYDMEYVEDVTLCAWCSFTMGSDVVQVTCCDGAETHEMHARCAREHRERLTCAFHGDSLDSDWD